MLPPRYLTAACALLAVASQPGCDRHRAPSPSPTAASGGLVVIEQNSQSLGPHDTGAVFAERIANDSDHAVPFAGVTANADPTLTVTVLGLSDCSHGCVGAGPISAETEREARASVDPSLTAVPPTTSQSRSSGTGLIVVVLLVRVAAHPKVGTCAYVHSLTPASGPTVTATNGAWVASVSTRTGDVALSC